MASSASRHMPIFMLGQMNEPSGYGVRLQAGSTEMHSPVRNTKCESWWRWWSGMHRDGASKAVEAAQSQARPSHGRSEQIASNCSKHVVGVGSNGETKGRKASGTDRTFSDFRRAERYQEHIWGAVLGAPHLARGFGATHRAKHGAICVGAEQRYTNGCPCCVRGVL